MTQSPCRIDGLLAAEANQVVLLRRGPSLHVQQLVWDLERDEIIPGQWVKHRIYPRRCDVSPDGKYLVYAAYGRRPDRHEGVGSFTAISRAPYFSALALWFSGCLYYGGGMWDGNRHVLLNAADNYWTPIKLPGRKTKVTFIGPQAYTQDGLFVYKLLTRGWVSIRDYSLKVKYQGWRNDDTFPFDEDSLASANLTPRALRNMRGAMPRWLERLGTFVAKPFPGGCLLREVLRSGETWYAVDLEGTILRSWRPATEAGSVWAEISPSGQLIFAEEGCLYRWPDFPAGEPELVADLNPNRFEHIAPPDWALSW